jgi:hypothetical protein
VWITEVLQSPGWRNSTRYKERGVVITTALQISTKRGDDIYVIGGENWIEFEKNLTAVFIAPEDVETMLGKMATAFVGGPTLASVTNILPATVVEETWENATPAAPAQQRRASAGPAPGQTYAAPVATAYVAASQAPAAPGRMCPHGAMAYQTGGGGNTGKRAWAAYFCPLEKGNPAQCKAQFTN